ncbi:MAG: SCP/PR1 domain protein [Parcubacteria group bacterium Gr01-1014_31]|nr:MAG: SCP/PR1 domain protein [Parcubacteria group bacterium Gr01-1014_31]
MKKRGSWGKKLALLAIGAELAVGVGQWIARRFSLTSRAKRFARGEAGELEQLFSGKEGWRQFFRDSHSLLRDFLIPHHGNDHRPHALRPRSLLTYTVAAVLVKVIASGALFLYFPTPAKLARIVAQEIVALANQSREEAGIPGLRVEPLLVTSALRKGEDMIARDYFAHDTPDGRKPWSFIDRERYDYVYAGENLAVDFMSADAIHEAFMRSPSHRANIMNARYQDIGVAVVNGTLAGRETELLVQFFGTRRQSPTLAVAPAATPTPQPSPSPTAVRPTPTPVPVAQVSPTPEPSATPTPAPIPQPLQEPPTLVASIGGERGLTLEPSVTLAGEPILVLGAENRTDQLVAMVLSFSNFFLMALVVFLAAALLLNIFVHIRVQHPTLIVQSIAVLSLLIAMVLTKLHFLERVGSQLRIL